MSTIASFYTTDLEATTALVLDRSGFLDSVTDAVNYEDKDNNAAKMVSILGTGAYFSILSVLLQDADATIRNKAFLALGNLIASDNDAVAKSAVKYAYNAISEMKNRRSPDIIHGLAYVLGNLAQYFARRGDHLAFPSAKPCYSSVVTRLAKEIVSADTPAKALRDLLWVFKHLKAPTAVDTQTLIAILKKKEKKTFKTALYLLGEQVSELDFASCKEESDFTLCEELYDYLSFAIDTEFKAPFNTLVEHLWILSNLLVEPGMGSKFFQDGVDYTYSLYEDVLTIIRLGENRRAIPEAVWVLANALHHVKDLSTLSHFQLTEVADVLRMFLSMDIGGAQVQREATATIARIEAEITARTAPVAEPETTTVYDDYNYDNYNDNNNYDEADFGPADMEIDEVFNYPCEIPCAPTTLPSLSIFNPPSAITLLQRKTVHEFTSETVYNLIRSVEANNLQFTPIPTGTTLTVEDLKALEQRGYSIVRGMVGINPAITVALYGTA